MPRQQVEDGGRRRSGCFQHQIVAVEANFDAGVTRRFQRFGGAHNLALQIGFCGADWAGSFASAPSATVSALNFNVLVRTVGSGSSVLPSASLATVRGSGSSKPLAGLGFSTGADDADGVDGRA